MYNGLSATALANFQNGDMQYVQLTIGTDILTNNRIIQGSFAINSYVITGESITFGSCVASELTFTLNNYDGAYDDDDFIGKEIYVEIGVAVGNTYEYVPFGYYIVDEATVNRTTVSIVALDRMTLFDVPVNSSALTFPCTTAQLLTAICSTCNVTLATTASSITNASLTLIGALPEQTKTYRDLLKWICEISGTNAYMNRNGSLVLAWFPSTSSITAPTLNESTRTQSSIDTTDFAITGVTIIADNAKTSAGTTVRPIIIQDNPLILPADYQTVVNNLNTKVNGFTYHPFTAVNLPTPVYDVMDVVVFSKDSVNYNVFITEITFKLNGNTALACGGDKQVKGRSYGLQDATLYAGNIAAGAITTDKLAAGAVTADAIAVGAVTSSAINSSVDMATNAGVAATYATQADAIKREQKIYRRTTTTTAPTTPTSWVTSTSDANNAWTTKPIAYNSTYKYLWVCWQRETVSGTLSCTTPVRDSTITVIDGGNIITGTVTANQIGAGEVKTNNIDSYAVTAEKISVSELASLHATIGGLSISDNSITSSNGAFALSSTGDITSTKTYAGSGITDTNTVSPSGFVATRAEGNSEETHSLRPGAGFESSINESGVYRGYASLHALDSVQNKPALSMNYNTYGNDAVGYSAVITTNQAEFTSDNDDKIGRFFRSGMYTENGWSKSYVNPNLVRVQSQTGASGDYSISKVELYDQYADHYKTVYVNNAVSERYRNVVSAGAVSIYEDGNLKSTLNAAGLKVKTHDLLRMSPHFAQMFATEITSGKDIKTTPYLKCGQYYTVSDVITQSLSNCPTRQAFTMFVLSPISPTYDNESSSTYVYRIRIIIDLMGRMWVQSVYSGSTAGSFYYNTWNRIVDVPTSVAYTAVTSTTAAGLTLSTSLGNTRYRKVGQMVEVNISVSGANTSWQTVFTLPSDYKPQEAFYAPISTLTMGSAGAYFAANGDVMVKVPSGSGVTVGGTITFPVVT